MRRQRLIRFGKKNRLLLIVLKTSFVFYLSLFMAAYLISSTTAYYSSASQVSQGITAGVWSTWDDSDLAIVDADNPAYNACPADLTVTIANNGEGAMEDAGTYEVYYSETGDPETEGETEQLGQDEGAIGVLEAGGTSEVTYTARKPGFYQFMFHQHKDHPGDQQVWSPKIEVICDDEPEEPEEDEQETSETDQQEAPPEKEKEEVTEKPDTDKDADKVEEKEEKEDKSVKKEQPNDTEKKPGPDSEKTDNNEGKQKKQEKQEKQEEQSKPKQKAEEPEKAKSKQAKKQPKDDADMKEEQSSEKAESHEMGQ